MPPQGPAARHVLVVDAGGLRVHGLADLRHRPPRPHRAGERPLHPGDGPEQVDGGGPGGGQQIAGPVELGGELGGPRRGAAPQLQHHAHRGRDAYRRRPADDHRPDRPGHLPRVAAPDVRLPGRQPALVDHDHFAVFPSDCRQHPARPPPPVKSPSRARRIRPACVGGCAAPRSGPRRAVSPRPAAPAPAARSRLCRYSSTDAMAALINVARNPPSSATGPRRARSGRRSGARPPMPPRRIPIGAEVGEAGQGERRHHAGVVAHRVQILGVELDEGHELVGGELGAEEVGHRRQVRRRHPEQGRHRREQPTEDDGQGQAGADEPQAVVDHRDAREERDQHRGHVHGQPHAVRRRRPRGRR